MSRYEHFEALASAGEEPKELTGPEFPEVVQHVFEWFLQLHNAKQGPITYSEIKAWSEMTGNIVRPFEVQLIKRLDITYLNQQSDGS